MPVSATSIWEKGIVLGGVAIPCHKSRWSECLRCNHVSPLYGARMENQGAWSDFVIPSYQILHFKHCILLVINVR